LTWWSEEYSVAVKDSEHLTDELALFTTVDVAEGDDICSYWGTYIGIADDMKGKDRVIRLTYALDVARCIDGHPSCPATYINDGMHGDAAGFVNCEYVENVDECLSSPHRIVVRALCPIEADAVCFFFLIVWFCLSLIMCVVIYI
jgi:hypothetical protein